MASTDPITLEQQGWQALSSTGEQAAAFYDDVLAQEVVMLLPGGLLLDDRAAIVASMAGIPWSSYELSELRALHPTPDTAVVCYRVVARRGESAPYDALVSSTYARRDRGWKLVVHQQTPC
ncbi:hypothetical protein AVL61_06515 [Kocuria rosea subsp. polaris]|uniref:DUF4440 domain-containing protein n=1 Tax=Kocuria rosea subsp. polaris TaxID=136273 RepID=A0A0W8IA93_KOCRO|nr:nuclear transport factor 2 family protein [Kocuria polaris]KUG56701.1 hypothetical protein AVL61_06515 [Kocuria polaris]